ncbi:MAG: hypothetical protein P9L94_09085 [Candidatus Hinthialibacter antarcticus]|nr:hypothetical protein [Candidatus Hinthialibacter antarcticus]
MRKSAGFDQWTLKAAACFATAFFLAVCPASGRPVVLELFIANSGCSNCRFSIEAVQQLREEFSKDELHVLVHPILASDALTESERRVRFLNANARPTAAQLPLAVFDGFQRIPGASGGIFHSYSEVIRARQAQANEGALEAWMDVSGGGVIASATYVGSVTPTPGSFQLHLAITQERSSDQMPIVRYFETLTPEHHQQVERNLSFVFDEPSLDVYLILQDEILQDEKSKKILVSIRATPQASISVDLNNDGRLDARDAFFFALLWAKRDPKADINVDGLINGLDILNLIGPRP